MRLSCKRENLSKALAVAAKTVKTRVSLPVLSNIMIATDRDRVKVVATDLESSATVWLEAKIEEEGAITVPARTILEYAQSSSDDVLEIVANDTDVRVKGGQNNATIKGIAADEFPIITPVKSEKGFKIAANTLKNALLAVSSAAALDETRPVLSGILFLAGKDLRIVATDSYRLAEQRIKLDDLSPSQAIVSQRTATELARTLPADDSIVEVSIGDNQVQFLCQDILFLTRQIEGNFPDYNQIIPKEFVYEVICQKDKLVEGLRVASIFARESGNNIKLSGEDSKIILSAVSAQTGDSQTQVEASTKGSPLAVSFNVKFLLDGINAITSGEVKLQLSGPLSPGLLSAEGDSSFRYVIMPLRSE